MRTARQQEAETLFIFHPHLIYTRGFSSFAFSLDNISRSFFLIYRDIFFVKKFTPQDLQFFIYKPELHVVTY